MSDLVNEAAAPLIFSVRPTATGTRGARARLSRETSSANSQNGVEVQRETDAKRRRERKRERGRENLVKHIRDESSGEEGRNAVERIGRYEACKAIHGEG